MRKTLTAAAIALALIVPTTAASASNAQTVTVRVDVGNFDLSSSEGREAAEAHVNAKLVEACTVETRLRYNFGRNVVDQKCLADARSAARAQVERVAANDARASGAIAAN
ncbi:MAG: UrcA family protein [Erythrobacter sp.]|uniref:UrcA family protein n=1 Tax=Erythrobacter sp. Alg231-14 TaxID=1922225 RepID=UPI000D5613EC